MTPEPIRYLIIETDGTISLKDGTLDTKDVSQLIGDFEMLPTPTDIDIIILVSEDAKSKGENANWAVTRLIRSRLRPDDFVAGRAIVTGPATEDGEPTSVSQDVEKTIRDKVAI